ncbi:hypothetical protein FTO74_10495 [Granulicella sp. WH15]|uniref:hypothetical protein n=1 Tax=Granulicella sp. WH15 TaxID=2602070 RepID=UPI0013672160|nr:hypothetical protein [Granulicella sp. WH15]QHN03752.1 hypothetical protein FTO74_10495 [Granulicella sp. WH15]
MNLFASSTIASNLLRKTAALAAFAVAAPLLHAAQLSSDGKSSIPKDIQQIIVVDYRAMQNSPAAMNLKDRVLPPELKRLETALKTSGLKVDQDADTLAFASFRQGGADSNNTRIVGIAQGQFHTNAIMANFLKQKTKPVVVRNNSIYPLGSAGMSVVFLNQTTMVFGDRDAVRAAIDARDGLTQNFLANADMVNEMTAVDSKAIWSLLDQKGTQNMMRGVMGDAAGLADYDTVRNRMKSSRYTMDFSNGVKFEMAVVMSDTITAATAATLMKGVSILKKTSGDQMEKNALDATNIDSNSGTLTVDYSSSDSQFSSLLSSSLFQSVVH